MPANRVSVHQKNPYVGPRPFTHAESSRFFGRDREAQRLYSLVVSERLVLFYAQSGAGKSSLVRARLIPRLRQAQYAVLPPSHVGGELPAGIEDVANVFAFNLMLSLDRNNRAPQRFANLTLSEFLWGLASEDGEHYSYDDEAADEDEPYEPVPYFLIIDQFEEIFTEHRERWQEREEFFDQICRAMMDDPMLWVILVLREDWVAALDPYAHLLPGTMRARFYMQRMGIPAALAAIQRPAEQAGRPFAEGAAEELVDNLRRIRGPAGGTPQYGQFVEPVQLQVVCYQLWQNLAGQPGKAITRQDVARLGNVDSALAQFYEEALASARPHAPESEITIRDWFARQLITEAGTRGTVYQGETMTAGLANETVHLLEQQFLLRAETRAGGRWYELVHDTFVEPILQANRAWRRRQNPLIQAALAWERSGRSNARLLVGQALAEATANLDTRQVDPLVKEFLVASGKLENTLREKEEARQRELAQARALAEIEHQRANEQARFTKRLRQSVAVLAVLLVLALATATIAFISRSQARAAETRARGAEAAAVDARQIAELSEQRFATSAAENSIIATSFAQQNATVQAFSTVFAAQTATSAVAMATAQAQAAVAATLSAGQTATALRATDSALRVTATATPTPTPRLTSTPLLVPGLPKTRQGITIFGISIDQQGQVATVDPGSLVTLNVAFTIKDEDCPGCIDQILIGIAGDSLNEAKGCVYVGVPGSEGVTDTGPLTFVAPEEPGRYDVRFRLGQAFSCDLGWWSLGDPPGADHNIGVLIVRQQ